jgi:hypothetical protein
MLLKSLSESNIHQSMYEGNVELQYRNFSSWSGLSWTGSLCNDVSATGSKCSEGPETATDIEGCQLNNDISLTRDTRAVEIKEQLTSGSLPYLAECGGVTPLLTVLQIITAKDANSTECVETISDKLIQSAWDGFISSYDLLASVFAAVRRPTNGVNVCGNGWEENGGTVAAQMMQWYTRAVT